MAIIRTTDIFGEPYSIECEILGEQTHGFYLPSGAWALCSDPEDGNTPAVFIVYRKKGERKVRVINKRNCEVVL